MRRLAIWAIPSLLCLSIFWAGLECWFQQDDFAWLGLRMQVHDRASLLDALFAPKAQGTIRPWSERIFFMGFSKLFGLDAFPYRLLVFATQLLNLWLLSRVAWRLSGGNSVAAVAAPCIWTVNASLGTPMSWTSAYNQVLCAAFLLGAFLIWLRFVETRDRRLYAWQFVVYVLGFGSLEMNVVYPAIAAAHALAAAPRFLPWTLPMGAVSGAYILLHNAVAPKVREGPYALHVDGSMISTLGTYWVRAFGAGDIGNLEVAHWLKVVGICVPWVLSAGLLVFAVTRVGSRRWVGLIGFAWFLFAIAPVLPLRDHISDYYLAIPTIGLALAGGEALARLWSWRPAAAALTAAVVAVLLAPSATVARATAVYNRDRSQEAERFVFGVQRAREIHPNKVILLTDVPSDLFWSTMNDKAFRLVDAYDIFLAPGAEQSIQPHPELGDVSEHVYPSGQLVRALDRGEAEVYAAGGGRLRRVTTGYRELARNRFKPGLAQRIDIGNPRFAEHLGPGWHKEESGYRWMSKRATVYLAGPVEAGAKLSVSGFVPAVQVAAGVIHFTATVDGSSCPILTLEKPDSEFHLDCPILGHSVGKERVEIVLKVDKVFIPPGDGRELGVVVTTAAIQK